MKGKEPGMKKWLAHIVLLAFLCPITAFAAVQGKGSVLSGTVRVCLSSISDANQVDLTLDGSYTLGENGNAYSRGTSLHISNRNGTLYLQSGSSNQSVGTQMKLRRHDTAGVNGIRIAQARYPSNLYPGDLEIRASGTSLQLIVHVFIEDYLMGVVPYEMDNDFPLECLKAQAVAARTYALKKMSMQSSVYDVVDTTSDQVYNGTPDRAANCIAAVQATAGVIGLINGEYMATFYTASNGGQTESVRNAWGSNTYKYLVVKDDPYDLKNPASIAKSVSFYKEGTTSVPALTELLRREAAAKLGLDSVTISGITGVRATSPKYGSESHVFRTVEVDLTIKGSGSVTVALDYFGQVEGICAMSINSMQNETLTVTQTVGGYKLTARRFGHGIGMSQRGAQQMASDGMKYEQILGFYYPGLSETSFTFERTLLSSLDGTGSTDSDNYIDAGSAAVNLSNPLDVLNLRKSDSLTAPVLAVIPHGTRVTLLEGGSEWSRIQYGTLSGYVKSEYLITESAILEETQSVSETGTAVVVLSDESQVLNLRASPTTAANVLSYLRSGQVLSVLERYSKWTQVRYGSVIGYVMNDYIKDPEESGREPAAIETAEKALEQDQVAIVLPSTGLNLRLSASIRSAVITVLPQGTIVNIRSGATGGMLPVSIGNITGFVAAEYVYVTSLQTPEPTTAPTVQPAQQPSQQGTVSESFRLYARVNAENGLILRTGPAQQADAVRLLENGTLLMITGEAESGFFPVIAGSDTGYVSENYLIFTDEADALISAPESSAGEGISDTATPVVPTVTPSPVPPASRVLSGESAYVNARGGLNLRSEPDASSRILTVIADGMQVVVLGSLENGFYPVRIGTLTGYLNADYLQFGKPPQAAGAMYTAVPTATPVSETDAAFAQGTQMVVNSQNGLNLRSAPSISSQILAVLPYGAVVTADMDTDDDFIHVRWNNYDGYVSRTYVSPIDPEH